MLAVICYVVLTVSAVIAIFTLIFENPWVMECIEKHIREKGSPSMKQKLEKIRLERGIH